jgi:murein DD-endopeptidase MepM/ murein hydrolase activator NlpD
MPIGTPVTAAREGIVAVVRADSEIGGADRKFLEDANFVSIYHADGTIANYLHLNTNGVVVKEGQHVKKGEMIGYSGNTGFSSGPHLHFEVLKPGVATANKSIEFKWDTQEVFLLSSTAKKSIWSIWKRF